LSVVFILNILHGKIDSNELNVSIQRNENRQTRNSRYLTERNHTSAYGYNASLSRGVRLFNLFVNCYDKENLISVDTYKKRLKLVVNCKYCETPCFGGLNKLSC
jgi:hypothetical protein